MSTNTSLKYYQKNRDAILKKTGDKYNNPEVKIKKIMYEKNKYRSIMEEKNKRRNRERNRYRNMIEEEKEKYDVNMQELDMIL